MGKVTEVLFWGLYRDVELGSIMDLTGQLRDIHKLVLNSLLSDVVMEDESSPQPKVLNIFEVIIIKELSVC